MHPFEFAGPRNLVAAIDVVLLVCAAARRDWTTWASHLERAQAILADTSYFDVDLARAAERAGEMAAAAGRADLAEAVNALARAQYQAMGRVQGP